MTLMYEGWRSEIDNEMSRGAKEGTFPYYLEAAALEAATHSNRHEYKLKDKETHAHCTDTLQIHCSTSKNEKKPDTWTQSADTQIDAHIDDTDTQSMIYRITNTDTKRHQHKKTQTDQRPKPPFLQFNLQHSNKQLLRLLSGLCCCFHFL